MKTNAKKHAAGAVFPSSRIAAPARSLGAARARVAGDDETSPVVEKRLKAAAPEPTRSTRAVRSVRRRATSKSAAKAKRKQPASRAAPKTKAAAKTGAKSKASSKSPQAKRAKRSVQANKSSKSAKSVKAPKTSASRSKTTKAVKPARKPNASRPATKLTQSQAKARSAKSPRGGATASLASSKPKRTAKVLAAHAANHNKNQPVVLLSHRADTATSPSSKSAVTKATAGRAAEVRSAPAVVPSSPATHTGRGDATLARYMSELATYELLGRDDEIRLAQEVESLEVSFWRVMLGMPQAWEVVEPAIRKGLEAEQAPSDLTDLGKAAQAAASSSASKASLTRYEREVERAAGQLRSADIHREAAKGTFAALQDYAESSLAQRSPSEIRAVETFMREVSAARRAQQAAKDRFVAANLRLVVSMARRYAREGRMPLADLIQEGNLGLMKAVERFDHRRGFRFSTYASWWIRHALTRGLADKGRLVRLPVHALETRTRLARATRKLTCRTGVAPTIAELAAETGLDPEKLPAVEELSTEAPFSLDAPVGGDNDRTFLDMLRYEDQTSAEETVVSASHKESLVSLMGELSPFEAQILRYRYGFDGGEERTLKEIGQMYNLSRERIRQIQACALAKMRARVDEEEQREGAAL
jgi:RNA polymerase primary sigma factor